MWAWQQLSACRVHAWHAIMDNIVSGIEEPLIRLKWPTHDDTVMWLPSPHHHSYKRDNRNEDGICICGNDVTPIH